MCFIHNLLFLYARHIALSISTMGWFSVWNPQLKCDDFRISLRLQTSMEWSNQDETAPSAICKLSPHHFYVRNVYNEHLGGQYCDILPFLPCVGDSTAPASSSGQANCSDWSVVATSTRPANRRPWISNIPRIHFPFFVLDAIPGNRTTKHFQEFHQGYPLARMNNQVAVMTLKSIIFLAIFILFCLIKCCFDRVCNYQLKLFFISMVMLLISVYITKKQGIEREY